VIDQTDEISASADAAIDRAAEDTDALGVEQGELDAARAAVEDAVPMITTGVLAGVVSGIGTLIAIASGAFLGGGLAVIVALGDGGLTEAAVMLVVVLVANLALENFVEPKVMGRTLDVHPLVVLVVLVVTALGGGLLGGIVGLILAVPAWVIAGNAIARLRSTGVVDQVADRAQPAVHHLLD
jgi:putative heme transporter